MGGKASKYHTPASLADIYRLFEGKIMASRYKEEYLSLEKKLLTGMRYDEWVDEYFEGNKEKAHKLLLVAVGLAEEFEQDIMCHVHNGVLELNAADYSVAFCVIVSYIMQYSLWRGSQSVLAFKVHMLSERLNFETSNKVTAIIETFPAEGVLVSDSDLYLLRLGTMAKRGNSLGYQLPSQMLRAKEMDFVLKQQERQIK